MRYGEADLKIRKGVTQMIDNDNEKPMFAKVTVINAESNKVEGVYNSGINTGKFVMALNPYYSYKLIAEAKGYETKITEIHPMVEDAVDEEPELKIVLKKL
jgi:uncharacterized protein YktA (UPF0223 family)